MITVTALLIALFHQVVTYNFSYSELEYLGGSCYPRDSCSPPRKDDEDHLWGNYTCECGMHCIRYGTCCVDSPHVGRSLDIQYLSESCEKPPGFQDAVILVTRCSDRMHFDSWIRLKCERVDGRDVEDPVGMAPVTSLETHITYKNYFCAMCNYDIRDILLWDVGLEFRTRKSVPDLSDVTGKDILENLAYSDERKSWGMMKGDAFHAIKMKFNLPHTLLKFVKKCYPNMINQCDPDYAINYELRYKCWSYYAPVKPKEVGGYARRYRNIHCFVCNSGNASVIDGNVCKLDKQRGRTKPSFSFALLLDINRSDGDLVGKKQECGHNEKWDPFFKKCRHLSCILPGHVLKDGKCVQN